MEFWCHDTKYHGKSSRSYSVTTSGICAGTSSATTVAILPATNPTITASGPLTFCQGDSIELTSSDGISFLWSTGETTQSVTVKLQEVIASLHPALVEEYPKPL
ncbi:MAG: hypothetical protein IPP42_11720 [Saprospiraceae bacterium]|nr:hypothetical protein [Saprospiraceae bacterium]